MIKDSNFRIKNRLQDWLQRPSYKYMVTIECDRYNEMSKEELEQRLRILDFKLNKKFMICKFPKLPLQNRFWSIGFIEKTTDDDRHMHIMMFVPDYSVTTSGYSKNTSPLRTQFVAMDIIQSWLSIKSKKPNGKFRKLKLPHIMRIKENMRTNPLRYASKQIGFDFDNMFFGFDDFDTHNTTLFNN